MASFNEYLKNVRAFITEYQSLIDCHLVDFITDNLWENCLSDSLREELEFIEYTDCERGSQEHFHRLMIASPELNVLMMQADSLFLKNSQLIKRAYETATSESEEAEAEAETAEKIDESSMSFMSNKKQYEIMKLAQLVGCLAVMGEKNLVIDAGAGKGYLSMSMSENYRVSVLAVDSSKSHEKSAIRRQEIIHKKKPQKRTLIQYSVQHIDDKTDYLQLIRSRYPDWSVGGNCVLSGLHTCGQLAHSMIKSFLTADCIKSLCVVPCCYHLTEETLTESFELSKNARMLAQQSVERIALREAEPHPPSLFYRAVLQIILQSLGIPKTRIGRGAPTQDFPSYVYWALTKIGVDSEKIPSDESLAELYEAHLHSRWKFNVFQSIRVYLGSVVEAAIVLDRVVHLQNSGRCFRVLLMQLFDPLISPRCYAITAVKTKPNSSG